jgi:BMFP domain-containing protein YqiC
MGAMSNLTGGRKPMDGKFMSELSRLFGGALNNMASVKKEMEKFVHDQIQQFFQRMDIVSREEFEAVQEMLKKARDEQEQLKLRLEALENEQSPVRKAK